MSKQVDDYSTESIKKKIDEITIEHYKDLRRLYLELAEVINQDKNDPKYMGIPNINFSLTAPNDDREPEHKKQRLERGFDVSETWSLRDTIADFVLPRLRVFRDIDVSRPGSFDSRDEWNDILDKMIRAFEIVQLDNKEGVYDDDVWLEYTKGMRLFGKYFLELWW